MMESLAWFDSLVGLLSLLIGILLHKCFTARRRPARDGNGQLLAQMEEEARRAAALPGRRRDGQAREQAREKAREVVAAAIRRLAPDYRVETAVSVVDLPSADMKGRIIGRE